VPDYFTLPELRALPDVSNETKYPNARCEAAAAKFVDIIEREVGTSFITRTITGERHNGGGSAIVLKRPFARSITSATENGAAVTDELVVEDGVLYRLSGGYPVPWRSGILNVSVTYTSGYSSTPPADIKEQALQATRLHLMATAATNWANSRQTSMSNEQGVIGFVVAGPDRPTGYPELDAVINGWKAKLDVFGFA
jgi:hypothetical protein